MEARIKHKTLILPLLAVFLLTNCATYYFSSKNIETGKYETGLGANKSFQREYSVSDGIHFISDNVWSAPPIYIYLKAGLPQRYNLSFGLTSNYFSTGLTAGLSKRVKQFSDNNSEISIGAGGTAVLVPKEFWEIPEPVGIDRIIPDFVNWGVYFSVDYFKSIKEDGFSLKYIIEYQHTDSSMFDFTNVFDNLNNIFFFAYEKGIGESFHIMPYLSMSVGFDPFAKRSVYCGGAVGVTFFFR